jgi:hypothetical protein
MAIRIVLAAIAGGLVMFAWLAAANMSPLGEAGISPLPREALVTSTLDSGAGGAGGLYVFPASPEASAEVPSGFMVYYSDNIFFGDMEARIGLELAKDILQASILALLLAATGSNAFFVRLAFSAGVGLLAGMSSNISLTIWYGFPIAYTLVAGLIVAAGYLLAGTAIALILPRRLASGRSAASA